MCHIDLEYGTIPGQYRSSKRHHLQGTWKGAILPLLIPSLYPFTRTKGTIIFCKPVTLLGTFTLSSSAPVILNVSCKAVPCLICGWKTKISRCSRKLYLWFLFRDFHITRLFFFSCFVAFPSRRRNSITVIFSRSRISFCTFFRSSRTTISFYFRDSF
uniref:Uncharacterized protein MANES_02G149600 n=1 Tax=Rhizophora mucronata TaxID=61149 RepID=A0A2P2JQC2_RHIMU